MKITIKDVLRIILVLSCTTAAKLKPASYLDRVQQRLNANGRHLEQLHTDISARYKQISTSKKPKRVRFAPTTKVKTMRPKRTIDLLLEHGFAKKTQKLWSYEGEAYLKDKTNVSQKLHELLKHGHSLYIFKRNLRHISTEEIIKSLKSYLPYNRNEQLEELFKILVRGNYYEI